MNWRRLLKVGYIAAAFIVVGAIGFALWAMYVFGDYTDTEIARFENPAHFVEAVLVERSGNATVGMISLVYIVAFGAETPREQHFLADRVDGLIIKWLDDQTVQIHADSAKVFKQVDEMIVDGKTKETVRVKYEMLNTKRK